MFQTSVSCAQPFDDPPSSGPSLPCESCCIAALESVDCFFSPSASPPDFTGNVLRALLKAKAGTTVTLECKPQAYPIASILWKKGNLPIHTGDRCVMTGPESSCMWFDTLTLMYAHREAVLFEDISAGAFFYSNSSSGLNDNIHISTIMQDIDAQTFRARV